MSDTETTTAPTAWYLAEAPTRESGYSAAARWYRNMIAERWDSATGEWIDTGTNLWETLQEDPGWEKVSQEEAEAWIASAGGAAPGTSV